VLVGDHDDRLPVLVDAVAKQVEHVRGVLRVEVAGGLVGEHDRGPRCERAGDRHALLLPTRQLGRAVAQAVAEPDHVNEFVEPGLVGVATGDRQRQHDVLVGRQHGDEVERLEDEADLVAAQRGQLAVVERRDLDAVEGDCAGRGTVEAGQTVHERRLARARGTHHGGELAGGERDVDAGEGVDGGFALPVLAGETGGGDEG